jgi:hypothetical protein
MTRTVGRQVLSAEQHRIRLTEFRQWFFADGKFERPAEFVDSLRVTARLRVAEIPDVIERDRQPSDARDGGEIWEEILKSPVTIHVLAWR